MEVLLPGILKDVVVKAFKDPARNKNGIHAIGTSVKSFAAYTLPNQVQNTPPLFLTDTMGTNRLPTSAPALACAIAMFLLKECSEQTFFYITCQEGKEN